MTPDQFMRKEWDALAKAKEHLVQIGTQAMNAYGAIGELLPPKEKEEMAS